MDILVTHLSKWGSDSACLAGIDVDSGRFVRLKRPDGNFPSRDELTLNGRLLGLGDAIHLSPVKLSVTLPHRENVGFVNGSLRFIGSFDHYKFADALHHKLSGDVGDGFDGEPIQSGHAKSCKFTEAGNSLCLIRATQVEAYRDVQNSRKACVRWTSGNRTITSRLDDISLYPTNAELDATSLNNLSTNLVMADEVILACSISGWYDINPGYWVLVAGVHPIYN